MLISFKFKNYRSFRDETILDMEATSIKDDYVDLIACTKKTYLPCVSIFGKNGGGKSNFIRAFWFGIKFIINAQRTQNEKATIPVRPFGLDDFSSLEPTTFEYQFFQNKVKYIYGFSSLNTHITNEYLYSSPKGQKATVFSRINQEFTYPMDSNRKKKKMIEEVVAPNQLFFSIACAMNYKVCIDAMSWFREKVFFSRDYNDLGQHITEYRENPDMLDAIVSIAKAADVGIEDMTFKFKDNKIELNSHMYEKIPFTSNFNNKVTNAFSEIQNFLNNMPQDTERNPILRDVEITSKHKGRTKAGSDTLYDLGIADESDGTMRLLALAPAFERALSLGGVFVVDELDREMHPNLMNYIINRYQNKQSNPLGAQLIFTTHNTELFSLEVLRRDQIFFADKDRSTGASELFSMAEFMPRKDDNVHRAYLAGKFGAVPHLLED